MLEYLQNIFGGGGGPTPVNQHFAQGPAAGLGGLFSTQGGGDLFKGGLSSPFASAAFGAGGSILNANAQGQGLGPALLAGLGGGAAGYSGAQNAQQAQQREEERRRQIQALMARLEQTSQYGMQQPLSPATTGGMFGQSMPSMNVRDPLYTGLY